MTRKPAVKHSVEKPISQFREFLKKRLFKIARATVKQHHHYVIPTLFDDTTDTAIIQGACNDICNQNSNSKDIAKAVGSWKIFAVIMRQLRYSFHQLHVKKSFALIAAHKRGRDC